MYTNPHKVQIEKHTIGMPKLEAGWRRGGAGGGVADEDDEDLNWIQTVVCWLVLRHYTSICFHLARCFYRLTDWTGLLFLSSSHRVTGHYALITVRPLTAPTGLLHHSTVHPTKHRPIHLEPHGITSAIHPASKT